MSVDKPILRAVNVNASINKIIQVIKQKYTDYIFNTQFLENLPNACLDDDKFQQVMTNLIDNACKYSPNTKEIIVKTEYANNNALKISVIDFGVGIKSNDISKIFNKFVRLENHLTSKTQGNGLGLYITKNLVESMNGKIYVESELDKGTTFILELPFYNEEEVLKCSQQS